MLIFEEEGVMGLCCRRQHNDGEQGEEDQCSQAGPLPFRPSRLMATGLNFSFRVQRVGAYETSDLP
ncbi:MAG: hypothetical protein Ct9H300mP12_02150 [Acidimicrobiales bacterium]|nr:MAG: hypothetical protein Ct9H300mP12_02150 [Acidimicrobiales bacterium]